MCYAGRRPGGIKAGIMVGETLVWQTKYAFADQVNFLAATPDAKYGGVDNEL